MFLRVISSTEFSGEGSKVQERFLIKAKPKALSTVKCEVLYIKGDCEFSISHFHVIDLFV